MKITIFMMIFLLIFCSCSGEMARRVTVVIPEHAWERYSGRKMWYYLKWGSSLDDIRTVYVYGESEVELKVPCGRTIYFCAYPLGEMQCFGGATGPENPYETVVLSQNAGVVAGLFLNTEGKAAGFADFDMICTYADTICTDYRSLDMANLLKDMLNGELGKKSVSVMKPHRVEGFALTNGVWVSEVDYMGRFVSSGGMSPDFDLFSGVYRFWNIEENLELRIVVDDSGNVFHHIRQSFVPL